MGKIPLKVILIGTNHRVYDLYEEALGELKQLGQMGSVGEESDSNVSSATISVKIVETLYCLLTLLI